MSKLNSKSLSTLRQKFRRYVREFETEMANYRINPIQQEAEQKEEDPQHVESDQSDSEYINYIFHIVQVMVRDNHLMNNTLPYIYIGSVVVSRPYLHLCYLLLTSCTVSLLIPSFRDIFLDVYSIYSIRN